MFFGQILHKVFQATLVKCQEEGVPLKLKDTMCTLQEAIAKEMKDTLTSLESLDNLWARYNYVVGAWGTKHASVVCSLPYLLCTYAAKRGVLQIMNVTPHAFPMQSRYLQVSLCICRYALGISEEAALKQLTEYVPAIEEWCYKFMHSEPQQGLGDIEFKG